MQTAHINLVWFELFDSFLRFTSIEPWVSLCFKIICLKQTELARHSEKLIGRFTLLLNLHGFKTNIRHQRFTKPVNWN